MNLASDASLLSNKSREKFILQKVPRQRRRSNSSNNILSSNIKIKAIKPPPTLNYNNNHSKLSTQTRSKHNISSGDKELNMPRPPRLAFDISSSNYMPRIPTTPPPKRDYKYRDLYYNANIITVPTNNNINKCLNEHIEKVTDMIDDDEDLESHYSSSSLLSSSLFSDEDEDGEAIDPRSSLSFKEQFYTLRKEISVVKSSLAILQKDHKETLKEKKQLEEEYRETKKEVTKTLESNTKELETYNDLINSKMEKLSLELSMATNREDDDDTSSSPSPSSIFYDDSNTFNSNSSNGNDSNSDDLPPECEMIMNNCVKQAKELELLQTEIERSKKDFMELINVKEKIELLLGEKEKEYSERLRECEAVTEGQSGMINSMGGLLRELEGRMDRLRDEKQRHKNSLLLSSSDQNNNSNDCNEKTRNNNHHRHHHHHHHHHSCDNHRGNHHHRHRCNQSSISSNFTLVNHDDINGKKYHNHHNHNHHKSNNNSIDSMNLQKSKTKEINVNNDHHGPKELEPSKLVPIRCLSPPQPRKQTYTNPILLFTDEELVRHQSRFGLAKRWVEDNEVSMCQQAGCSVKFNLWNRRHHCRRCGNIFCSTHSAYSMLLFADGSEDWGGIWSRVCEGCFKR